MAHCQEIAPAAWPAPPVASDEAIGQRAAAAVGIASLVVLSLGLAALERITESNVS